MGGNIKFVYDKSNLLINNVGKLIIGQEEFIKDLVTVLLTGGHVLIEGVPGLAKTLAARAISKSVDLEFSRIQFTPDLMPADILGTKIFDMKSNEFILRKGPLFSNILLADEINRTPPKTQSALLEVMEEQTITIDTDTFKLDEPYMVLATQNPIEYEGTYPLPEAQLDRFLVKLNVSYTSKDSENELLKRYNSGINSLKDEINDLETVLDSNDILECRKYINEVKVEYSVINYITEIVSATRSSNNVLLGGSPRASIALLKLSKTYAAINGREYVIPEDIKDLAVNVLRHRVILKPEVTIDGITTDSVVNEILNVIEVPR